MKKQMLDRMSQAADALYLREYERIRVVMAEEARIAAQLARLDAQLAGLRDRDAADHDYRSVGADILWQAWETRTRRALNQSLARARAKRLSMMDGLRLAFGRKQAIAELALHHRNNTLQARGKRFQDSLCADHATSPDGV